MIGRPRPVLRPGVLVLLLAGLTLITTTAAARPERERERDRPGERHEPVGLERVRRMWAAPKPVPAAKGGVRVPVALKRIALRPEHAEVRNFPVGEAPLSIARPSVPDVVSTNVRANNTAGDGSSTCQSETHLAANGTKIVAAWNDGFNGFASPGGTGYSYSTDGGLTFTDGGVPPVTSGSDPIHFGDPVVGCDNAGNFYLADLYTPDGDVTAAIAVARGTFSGSSFSWNTPVIVASTTTDFLDKEWMAVDRSNGTIYVTWTRFLAAGTSRIELSRSTNNGATWTSPLVLTSTATEDVQGSRVVVGPNHEVQVLWYSYDKAIQNTYMRTKRSTNGGVSFGSLVTLPTGASGVVSNYGAGAPGFNRDGGIGFPSLAVDASGGANNGRLYATWEEGVNFYNDVIGAGGTRAETESNGTFGTANAVTIGQHVTGSLSSSTDQDWFSFGGTQGQTVVLYLTPVSGSTDPYINFYVGGGALAQRLGYSYLGTNFGGLVVITLPVTATYYFRIFPASAAGTGTYQVDTGFHTAVPGDEAGRDGRDVVLQSSADGTTWDTRRVINDDAARFDNSFPEVAVDAGGTVFVNWYDHRNDANGILTDVYYTQSSNAGSTWAPSVKVNDGAAVNWNSVATDLIPNMGDYSALVADGSNVYALFADGRGGSPDAWLARITGTPAWTITASAGAGGTIAPSGPVTVVEGQNQSFTITPGPCSVIADVVVDGVSVGAVGSYAFTNVTANHTIAASFTANGVTYAITASAGGGGSISPNGTTNVGCGGSLAYSITPDGGFGVADVLVDGVSVGPVTSYTFTNVTATHTIAASFASGFACNVTVVGNGAVTKSPDLAQYPANSSVQLTATPGAFAVFAGWSGDASGTTNPLTVTMNTTKNITATFTSNTYAWNVTGSGAFGTAANWTPSRTSPSTSDVLLFNNGATTTVTGVPTQTIAQLLVSNNTKVTLQVSSPNTLTIGGGSGTDLGVGAGSSITVNSANTLTIALGASATGSVSGAITFATAAHRLTSAATNALSFASGSVFTGGTGFTGNAFGTTSLNSVAFQSGSLYVTLAGANPFGASAPNSVVTFNAGSRFRLDGALTPSLSGRSYADFEYNNAGAITNTGASAAKVDNVFVTQGTWNVNLTAALDVKGGITVNSGATLAFSPTSAATTTFSGTGVQVITVNGTFTQGANETFEVKNAAGLQLATNWTLGGGGIKFTTGNVATGANTLILPGTVAITGASQATGWVNGRLRRNVPASASGFTFDVGDASVYAPASLTFTGLASAFDLTVSAPLGDHANIGTSGLDAAKSVNRTWTLSPASAPAFTSYAALLLYSAGDVDAGADPMAFLAKRWTGSAWAAAAVGARTPTSTQVTGLTGFGDLALGVELSYTIAATAGTGGTIAPTGSVSVASGASQAFTISPGPGNAVDDVLVDGSSVGAVASYTFTNVIANHTIAAVFADTTAPSVTVLYPNGEEVVTVDDVITLTWTAVDNAGPIANVDLELSRDHGATWEPIATTANDGAYDWTVTGPPTGSDDFINFAALLRVTAVDDATHTASDVSDTTFSIQPEPNTGVGDGPRAFELSAVSPNPSAGAVRIAYAIAADAHVELAILDVQGRVVRALESGDRAPGRYSVAWDGHAGGARVTPGLYFVRLHAGAHTFVRRLALTH